MDAYEADWARRLARRKAQEDSRRARRRRVGALAVVVTSAAVASGVLILGRAGLAKVVVQAKPVAPLVHRHLRATVVRPEPLAVSRTQAVPILMYHVIAAAPPGAPFPGLYVTRGEFAAQIHALVHAGFHGVTLDQLRAAWRGGGRLPRRPIVITFDNGYRSQYTSALPVLEQVRWVADENLQLAGLPATAGGITTREVRSLIAAGWELDTQGYDHADLTALDTAGLRFQVAGARRRLRRLYGVRADWFCYPSGRYNPAVVAAVRAAGYVGSTTVVPGWARPTENPFTLPRLRVLANTSPKTLLNQIANSRYSPDPPSSYLPAT